MENSGENWSERELAEVPKITFLGQSGFHLVMDSGSLVVDPKDKESGNRDGDILYCTHKHFDHTGGVDTFLERNADAIFVTNEQVAKTFSKWSERTIVVEPGETYSKGPWSFTFVECKHGVFRNISDVGVVVDSGEFLFGHPGDSKTLAGFSDFELDVLAVPISGAVSTSPKSAVTQIGQFKTLPKTVVAMHWLLRKPRGFCEKVAKDLPGVRCLVPSEGELLNLD
jgi:L-ascorbate metabolism protein UlaG (beta-lactamase superfamily)